jgi:hypothetical protein
MPTQKNSNHQWPYLFGFYLEEPYQFVMVKVKKKTLHATLAEGGEKKPLGNIPEHSALPRKACSQ